jgi:hypothetical protein
MSATVQFTGPLEGISTWNWEGTIAAVPESEHYGCVIWGGLGLLALRRRRANARNEFLELDSYSSPDPVNARDSLSQVSTRNTPWR